MKYIIITACLAMFMGASCKKNKPQKTELEKLPPITEIGANTFGCLVNGKAWIPEKYGIISTSPPLKFYFENVATGQLAINAIFQTAKFEQSINIGIDSCNQTKKYIYKKSPNFPIRFAYRDYNNANCYLSTRLDSAVDAVGFVEITRFDLQNEIIAGTFEFILSKTGCETISITNGRFDAKL